jgi:glucose/arabinose dehydrogenase
MIEPMQESKTNMVNTAVSNENNGPNEGKENATVVVGKLEEVVTKKPVPKGEMIIIEDEKKGKKAQIDLQANFKKFMQSKKDQIKMKKMVNDKHKGVNRTDPIFKQRLREKFIETAKKYFGVPYHRKYWKEGEEHYNAPLYLDCCGLTRQVLYDL